MLLPVGLFLFVWLARLLYRALDLILKVVAMFSHHLTKWSQLMEMKSVTCNTCVWPYQNIWKRSHPHWKQWPPQASEPAVWGRELGGYQRRRSLLGRPLVSHWLQWRRPEEIPDMLSEYSMSPFNIMLTNATHDSFASYEVANLEGFLSSLKL